MQQCHFPHVKGGGAFFLNCEVDRCAFRENICDDGSAFWAEGGTIVSNSLIENNRQHLSHPVVLQQSRMVDCMVGRNEWGIYATDSSQVMDCVITNNVGPIGGYAFACVDTAPGGGGLFLANGSEARRCLIMENSAGYGAGVMVGFGQNDSILQNCLVIGNRLQQFGPNSPGEGAGLLIDSAATIEHCTFAKNDALGGAILTGGQFASPLTTSVIRNNIVWGNDGTTLGPNFPLNILSRNILEGSNVGGNVSVDPLLDGEFRLTSDSPAIDSGDSANVNGPTIFGLPRILGARTDIGADEYHPKLAITVFNNQMGTIPSTNALAVFTTLPDVAYQFEITEEVEPLLWTNSGPVVLGGPGTNTTTILPLPTDRGFYRYRIAP